MSKKTIKLPVQTGPLEAALAYVPESHQLKQERVEFVQKVRVEPGVGAASCGNISGLEAGLPIRAQVPRVSRGRRPYTNHQKQHAPPWVKLCMEVAGCGSGKKGGASDFGARLKNSKEAAPEEQRASIKKAAAAFQSNNSCRHAIIVSIAIIVIVLVLIRSLEAGFLVA